MKSVSVFCGSSSGHDHVYRNSAYALGALLASKHITVIYGGAKVGLMGSLANGALDEGGKVVGILPSFLSTKELEHEKLTALIVVTTMHERKIKMYELSDGVIAMPGGFGTFDELFEILTWAQLGMHTKPVGIFNINGFYDPLLTMILKMVDTGFLNKANHDMIIVSDNMEDLISKMENYKGVKTKKWISIKES